MYLVVANEFLDFLAHCPENSGELWGEIADNQVVRLLRPERSPGLVLVGYWRRAGNDMALTALPEPFDRMLRPGQLFLSLNSKQSQFYTVTDKNSLLVQPYDRVNLFADYHSRTSGLFDSTFLQDKTVTVVGLGTGGGLIAAELAKAGVGHFRLVDFDRLKVHNLARHICGLRDLGRLKIEAVSDYLYNTNPLVKVQIFNLDILTDPIGLTEIVKGSDFVVGATDSEGAKDLLNRVAWQLAIPAVYGAAYDMGFGGDVFLANPPDGPCYRCFRLATQDMFNDDSDKPEVDYGKALAQPALGLDVSFISLIAARVVLANLLKADASSTLELYPANWILWGGQVQPGWLFEQPLQSEYIEIVPDPLCPVCHSEAFSQATLGMNAEQAQAEGLALLEKLKISSASVD